VYWVSKRSHGHDVLWPRAVPCTDMAEARDRAQSAARIILHHDHEDIVIRQDPEGTPIEVLTKPWSVR
jgi:hypothetical protein